MDDPKPTPPEVPAVEDLRTLMERARNGDRSALPALRAALDARPDVWVRFGDLAAHAEASWIRLSAGGDLGMAESLKRKVAALKAELSGPDPTPIERLLVERIGATYLQVNYSDAAVAQAAPDASLKQMDLALRRQNSAHKRYMQALGALATVRRLLPAGIEITPAHPVAVASDRVVESDDHGARPTEGQAAAISPSSGRDAAGPAPDGPPLVLFDPPGDERDAEAREDGHRERRSSASS